MLPENIKNEFDMKILLNTDLVNSKLSTTEFEFITRHMNAFYKQVYDYILNELGITANIDQILTIDDHINPTSIVVYYQNPKIKRTTIEIDEMIEFMKKKNGG